MLLDELHQIVKRGSQMPLDFWIDDLNAKKDALVSSLKGISDKLEVDTQIKLKIDHLIAILEQPQIDELSLSRALIFIPSLFEGSEFEELRPLIKAYVEQSKTFNDNALLSAAMTKARAETKARLKPVAQKQQDLELFQQGGMFFCLEYYLMLYKKIMDAPKDEEKKIYFEAEDINVGPARMRFFLRVKPFGR